MVNSLPELLAESPPSGSEMRLLMPLSSEDLDDLSDSEMADLLAKELAAVQRRKTK